MKYFNRYINKNTKFRSLFRSIQNKIDILNRVIAGEEISQEDEDILQEGRGLFNSLEDYLNTKLVELTEMTDQIKQFKKDSKDMEEMLEFVNKYT